MHKHIFTENAEIGTCNMTLRNIYDFSYVWW